MKAILEFELPEQNEQFLTAFNGKTIKVQFGTLTSCCVRK